MGLGRDKEAPVYEQIGVATLTNQSSARTFEPVETSGSNQLLPCSDQYRTEQAPSEDGRYKGIPG
jgi:hypothetical protein